MNSICLDAYYTSSQTPGNTFYRKMNTNSFHQKYLYFCSEDEGRSYGFVTT